MNYDWNPPAEDVAALRAWLAAWDALVNSVDFVPARALFAPNIASFGTRADVVEGIASLENNQWRAVWPAIEDFAFDLDGMKVGVSPDRLMAFLIATWKSKGVAEDGSRFDRPGRATVVLARARTDAPWLGIHTHFSLNPGTPAKAHGRRPAKS